METRAHYVAVGSFVLAIIFLAFIAVIWLGRVQLSQDLKSYYIFFRGSVAGLSKGSAVQYNGIPVGRVSDIRVDPDDVEQIQTRVEIDGSLVDIKSDARAFLETNILSGVSYIQIRGGTKEAGTLEPQTGHKYPVIKTAQTEIEQVKASLPELMGDIKVIAHELSSLFNDENRQAITATLANVETITEIFAERGKETKEVVANANAAVLALKSLLTNVDRSYTAPAGLKDQASQLITDYDRLGKNLNDTNRDLQQAIQENRPGLHEFSQRALVQVGDLLTETRQLVSGLSRLADEIERNPTRFLFGDRRDGYRPQ
jgi:phospholipid/cholesterol/gamma-HCH transport system substrate-binding protein